MRQFCDVFMTKKHEITPATELSVVKPSLLRHITEMCLI